MLRTESETYPAMISLDDKNYILLTESGKMKIHGSSLKGKHMPIVCDHFRDQLCQAVFKDSNVIEVFRQFRDLSKFPVDAFQIRIYPSKTDYHQNSLYNKLLAKLGAQGIRAVAGASLEYVKATDGYTPVILYSETDSIDYNYYKNRLAEIGARILDKPAKALRNWFKNGLLEEYSNV